MIRIFEEGEDEAKVEDEVAVVVEVEDREVDEGHTNNMADNQTAIGRLLRSSMGPRMHHIQTKLITTRRRKKELPVWKEPLHQQKRARVRSEWLWVEETILRVNEDYINRK